MKKMSLKLKLTFLIAAIVLTVVGVICLLNSIFFEKYYIKDREKKLVNSYNEMKEVLVSDGISSDSVRKKMLSINALHNINVFLVDSNWKTVYSTQNNIENTYRWLQHFIFSGDRDIELIKENDNYAIKKGNDISTGLSYMVIYGSMEDGSQLVMQLIIESIKENIKIFNNFVTITGAVVMVISIIFAYFLADKFTKPIKELSKIAEEMSELNFDAKYTGKAQNEICQLGKSINFMSDSLQKNITMLKTANYELQLDIEEKTKAADRQKEFLSNVSHELKTPIALIQGYAEGLKEGVAADKESFDFYCDDIEGKKCNIKKIAKIIEKILQTKFVIQSQNCGLREEKENCVFTYYSEDKYKLQVGVATSTKEGSKVSGDSNIEAKLDDGKYLIALSDGMGSGEEANQSSRIAINMLAKLLKAGFDKETSLKLINSSLIANTKEDMYTTLDIQILDLFAGNMEFIKSGACPTFVKRNKEVQLLKSITLPTGIVEKNELIVYDYDLEDGDILVMCSDGVIDSNTEYINKELWVKYLLEDISVDDAQQIANMVLNEAIDNEFGMKKDDMTVIVAKVNKKT